MEHRRDIFLRGKVYKEYIISKSMINQTQDNAQEDKKLLWGFPIAIQTLQEHKDSIRKSRGYFYQRKKEDIEQTKREIKKLQEKILIEKTTLKELRKQKFKPTSYSEWVKEVRERNKEYKIIENEDSIKIE